MMAILTDVIRYLIIVLICIVLIIIDVEHFFMGLYTICTSSLNKCLFRCFVHILIVFFLIEPHVQFSLVTHSCLTISDPIDCSTPGFPLPHHLPELAQSCPLSQRYHPTISSTVTPFSSCLQSFSTSGSFPKSQFFTSRGQSVGVSASVSVLPINIQDWFPLGWTGWISLQSKGLSRVFSNTTVQKHQFFSAQLSL